MNILKDSGNLEAGDGSQSRSWRLVKIVKLKIGEDLRAEEWWRSQGWRLVKISGLKIGEDLRAEDWWRSQGWRLVKIAGLKAGEDLRVEGFKRLWNWRLASIWTTDARETLQEEGWHESGGRRSEEIGLERRKKLDIGENVASWRWERESYGHPGEKKTYDHFFTLILGLINCEWVRSKIYELRMWIAWMWISMTWKVMKSNSWR